MNASAALRGQSLAERVRAAVEVAAVNADAVDRAGAFPGAAIEALRTGRLLGLAAPPALGGEGLSLAEISEICEALGGACASTGMIFAMHQINMANLLDCSADSEWHRAFAVRAAREQLLFASATTEAGVGGDLRQSVCAVETDGERFTLTKMAPVISYGEYADALFVTARRDRQAASSDQVLAIVTLDQCELERVANWDALGMRGTCSHGYKLTARAGVEQILPVAFADIAAESMVGTSHLLWSSVWTGVAAEALARAQAFVVAEAKKNPAAPPPSAPRLAEVYGRCQMLQAMLREACELWSQTRTQDGAAVTISTSIAMNALKVSASTTALEIVEAALMICGLAGYKNDGPFSLARHLRDIHSARLMIGNDRILSATGQMLLIQRRPTLRSA